MVALDNLSDSPNQKTSVTLDDGSTLALTFVFRPATQHWECDIVHPSITKNGMQLVVHPNQLRQFRSVIPFGLAIVSTDGADPAYIDDFTSGRVTVYVLNAQDVQDVETNILGALT